MAIKSLSFRTAAALLVLFTLTLGFAQYPIEQLRVGINTLPRTVEPFFDTTNTALGVYRMMFDTLVQVNEEGQPSPLLATSWSVTDDGAWEFALQEGVTFHDGTPFTAADVKYSLDWVLNPDNTAPWAGRIGLVSGVEIVDDYTVRLTTEEPYAALLQGLMVIHMVPEGYYEGDYEPAIQPVGTGRYRFVEWAPDDYLQVEAVEGSWHGDTTVGSIRFIEMPTANTRTSALRAGEIEVAYAVPPEQTADLERNGLSIDYQMIGHSMTITLVGARSEILADKRVRQAINYATPHEQILTNVFAGRAQQSRGPLVSTIPCYNDGLWNYETDIDRAKALLADAGYPDGVDITLEYSGLNWWEEPLGIQLKDGLAKAGIRVNLKRIPDADMTARAAITERNLPFFTFYEQSIVLDPGYSMLLTSTPDGSADRNDYNNPELTKLIQQANVITDETQRCELINQAQQIHLEDASWIYSAEIGGHEAMGEDIEGWVWHPDNHERWADLSR